MPWPIGTHVARTIFPRFLPDGEATVVVSSDMVRSVGPHDLGYLPDSSCVEAA
jgi:hypothetical protein